MTVKIRDVRRFLNIAMIPGLLLFSTGTAFAQEAEPVVSAVDTV